MTSSYHHFVDIRYLIDKLSPVHRGRFPRTFFPRNVIMLFRESHSDVFLMQIVFFSTREICSKVPEYAMLVMQMLTRDSSRSSLFDFESADETNISIDANPTEWNSHHRWRWLFLEGYQFKKKHSHKVNGFKQKITLNSVWKKTWKPYHTECSVEKNGKTQRNPFRVHTTTLLGSSYQGKLVMNAPQTSWKAMKGALSKFRKWENALRGGGREGVTRRPSWLDKETQPLFCTQIISVSL